MDEFKGAFDKIWQDAVTTLVIGINFGLAAVGLKVLQGSLKHWTHAIIIPFLSVCCGFLAAWACHDLGLSDSMVWLATGVAALGAEKLLTVLSQDPLAFWREFKGGKKSDKE